MDRPEAYSFCMIVQKLLWGKHMLISNNLPSKQSVTWTPPSYSIFDWFQGMSPSLSKKDAVPWAAPVSHYLHWWFSNRLLSSLPMVLSRLSCLWLLPTYIYLQQHGPALFSFPSFLISLLAFTGSLEPPFLLATSAITDSAQMGFVNCEVI